MGFLMRFIWWLIYCWLTVWLLIWLILILIVDILLMIRRNTFLTDWRLIVDDGFLLGWEGMGLAWWWWEVYLGLWWIGGLDGVVDLLIGLIMMGISNDLLDDSLLLGWSEDSYWSDCWVCIDVLYGDGIWIYSLWRWIIDLLDLAWSKGFWLGGLYLCLLNNRYISMAYLIVIYMTKSNRWLPNLIKVYIRCPHHPWRSHQIINSRPCILNNTLGFS